MTDNFQPTKHPMIVVLPSSREVWLVIKSDQGVKLEPDEAVKLGLALMETGLHVKTLIKNDRP